MQIYRFSLAKSVRRMWAKHRPDKPHWALVIRYISEKLKENPGLDVSVAVTTVNKVCSSGLKSVMLAAQQIQLGHQQLVIGGGKPIHPYNPNYFSFTGMESMSQVPYYLERGELPYGGAKLIVNCFVHF